MSKVYVYESCEPLVKITNKLTQVVQTERLRFTSIPNTIFKDSNGKCWNYIGEFGSDYIPNPDIFTVNYNGNYFEKNQTLQSSIFPTYDDCLTITLSACSLTFFNATRCDSGTTVNVKVCDVGPVNGSVKLLPTVGQVCGIYNPNGDDFCVTLNSKISEVDTDYEIITPGWENYDCNSCPNFKTYIVNNCNTSISGITIYDFVNSDTLSASTAVTTYIDNSCYNIVSYEGISIVCGYNSSNTPVISQTFNDCEKCTLNFYKTTGL